MKAQIMKPQKIIIDTDPGIDDAMAIHQAFADSRLEVVGLTTIFGNVYVEQATRNALWLAEQAAYECSVAGGALTPLVQAMNTPAFFVHGEEGFGSLTDIQPSQKPDPRPEHIYLSETIREHSGEIILCPVGPLTNIAKLVDYDPEIVNHVKKLVIMGGAVHVPGNVTSFAEANFWNDPHAADKVLGADWHIDLIGLDVTATIQFPPDVFSQIAKESPRIGGFIYDICEFYIDFYEKIVGKRVCLMHDPAALLAICDRDIFTFQNEPLSVIVEGEEVGNSIVSENTLRRAVSVAVGVDVDAAKKRFMAILEQADTAFDKRVNS